MKKLANFQTLIFDGLFWSLAAVIYGISLFLTVSFAQLLWSEELWKQILTLLLSYFVFIHLFILTLGLLKKIFQPPLVTGKIKVGLNPDYLAFALNSVFHGIFFTSPMAGQVGLIFYLNTLYYRLMGMKLGITNIIGTGTLIRQPELIEIGPKTVLGIGSILSCHFSPDGKNHIQGRIKVGESCLIGAYTQLAPDTLIGDRVIIGTRSLILSGVRIGSDVQIGMGVRVEFGSRIPDKVTIKSHTVITKYHQLESGQTWEGHPAKLVVAKGSKHE